VRRAWLLALLLCGCPSGHGLLELTVEAQGGTITGIDHLTIRVTDLDAARNAKPIDMTVSGGSVPPSQTVALVFGNEVNGSVRVTVDAIRGDGSTAASATRETTISPFDSTSLTITLMATLGDMGPDQALPDLACPTALPPNSQKYVMSAMKIPMTRTDWAIDLNGDGKLDNQYGNIAGALGQQNILLQPVADQSIAGGNNILLFTEYSADPAFASDPCGRTELRNGQNQAAPDFSGMGTFTVEPGSMTAAFGGTIGMGIDPTPLDGGVDAGGFASAVFDSPAPAMSTTPVTIALKLPLSGASKVSLHGAHIRYHYTGNGLSTGQINGAIPDSEVQGVLVPAMALQLDTLSSAVPCDTVCMQLRAIFDTGGSTPDAACPNGDGTNACRNPDTTCAKKSDTRIAVCEVSTNSIIKNILAPDVQMFDGMGNYAPNPANTKKDSLSVGFGFVAVKAKF
jgi:hypothetical protein